MTTRISLLNYYHLVFTFTIVWGLESELHLEEFFKESICIPEPPDDFFSHYILKNEVQDEFSTKSVKDLRNYRSEVNLLVQYNELESEYTIENEEGPTHKRIFNVSLQLGDEKFYGSGRTKKEAKEMAAKNAIQNTSYQKPPIKMKGVELLDDKSPPTVILNNLGLRHGYAINYYLVDPMLSKRVINLNLLKQKSVFTNSSFWKAAANLDQPPKGPFDIEVDVNGQSFYAKSHTIQTAKHEAANKAIEYLKQKGLDKNSVCTMKGYEKECEKAKSKLKSPISILYEYAQKRRLALEFKELDKSGPSHKPIFEMECILGTHTVTAEGKSKKEAKRKAAESMIEQIPELDLSGDNEVGETSGTKKLKRKKRKAKTLLQDAKDVLGNVVNFFSTEDNTDNKDEKEYNNEENTKSEMKKKKNKHDISGWSPKEKLIDSGKALNLNIKFHTMTKEKSGYYSVVSMDLNPTHICLGIGSNVEISQEYASLNALKFLMKLDVLEGVEEDDLNIERFSFDNYIWLAKDHTEKF